VFSVQERNQPEARLNTEHCGDLAAQQYLHFGASKPPEPLAIPFGRTLPTDIKRFTFLLLHSGQSGMTSSALR